MELVHELPDAAIEAIVAAQAPTVEIRHWGGAMARPAAGAGPVGPARRAALGDRRHARARGGGGRWRPHATGRSFLNFLADPARTPTAFAPADYEALREVKAAYDPDDVFRIGHAIAPAEATLSRRSAPRSREHPRRRRTPGRCVRSDARTAPATRGGSPRSSRS